MTTLHDTINLGAFIRHIKNKASDFSIRKDNNTKSESDAKQHETVWEQTPVLYALFATLADVKTSQRLLIFYHILKSSWLGFSKEDRKVLHQVLEVLLAILPAVKVLQVLLRLRRERVNHKHLTSTILKFILQHPFAREMIYFKRKSIQAVMEHALGKSTANFAKKILNEENNLSNEFLNQKIYRYKFIPKEAWKILPLIFQKRQRGRRPSAFHKAHYKALKAVFPHVSYPKTHTARMKGAIVADLVRFYEKDNEQALEQHLMETISAATTNFPQLNSKITLVLDVSGSTRGYGEREFASVAQAVAIKLVLQKCCPQLEVIPVGGKGKYHYPEGTTDLAMGLIQSLKTNPELVLILSDGYENVQEGDLRSIVASLPQMGIDIPILFCHNKYSREDDLSLRQAAPTLPQLSVWHQDEYEDLIIQLLAESNDKKAMADLKALLIRRLVK